MARADGDESRRWQVTFEPEISDWGSEVLQEFERRYEGFRNEQAEELEPPGSGGTAVKQAPGEPRYSGFGPVLDAGRGSDEPPRVYFGESPRPFEPGDLSWLGPTVSHAQGEDWPPALGQGGVSAGNGDPGSSGGPADPGSSGQRPDPDPELPVQHPDPWYARRGVHALGDAEVQRVIKAHDATADASAAVGALKEAVAATTGSRGLRISARLSSELRDGIVRALNSDDPVEWERHLYSGLVEGDGETVVRAWFSLVRRTDLAEDASAARVAAGPEADPVLSQYRSKYGDVTSEETVNKKQGSKIGFGAELLRDGAGAATLFGPFLDVSFSASRTDGRTLAHEVQAGSRPIVAGKAKGDYEVRIDLLAMSRQAVGGVEAHHDVGGMVVTATHPEPLTKGDLAAYPKIKVRNPAAVEAFKTTFGAIDSRPLEKAFLRSLLSQVANAEQAAEIAADAVREAIGEKPLRDRARYLPGGLPAMPGGLGFWAGCRVFPWRLLSVAVRPGCCRG